MYRRRVAIAIATHPPPPPPLAPQYTIGLTYIQGSKKHAKRDAIMLIPTCTIYREITFGLSLPADCARVCISTSPIPPLNSGCERNNERARNRIIHRTDGRTDGQTRATLGPPFLLSSAVTHFQEQRASCGEAEGAHAHVRWRREGGREAAFVSCRCRRRLLPYHHREREGCLSFLRGCRCETGSIATKSVRGPTLIEV